MTDAAKTKTVVVRATKPGFYLGRRRVGQEFAFIARVVDGKPVLGSWMEPVGQEAKPQATAAKAVKPEQEEPRTFSEGAKHIGADLV